MSATLLPEAPKQQKIPKVHNPKTPTTTKEPLIVQWTLIGISVAFLSLFLLLPLAMIFISALQKGVVVYVEAITNSEALSAIKLTLLVVLIVVPLNTLFGILSALLISHHHFKGKSLLLTLIDLPFAVSPVIAGLIFVLIFGAQGLFGEWLLNHDIYVIFALPGIVLATLFVTVPFVARELIPLMQSQGQAEEEASHSLGASALKTFIYITLPKIKWGLLYGIILCNARVIGEFGAVSVVSGHIRGLTNTMPLHIEVLYNEYQFTAAFAVASLMSILALLTILIKNVIEWRSKEVSS
ncbi:sulfate ABC transporter permease subunit CysW [Kurthia sibirica]|uniref:Sulfate ABC transporter permease subunit CysW n=1 Tax=Kurthia sibirica TaxID=202750 RepID=A0A2U3AQI8_9BACL|nr:sulfate ABC transporter permease subunit CysW [Kurthia sibirica]PWI26725.1 sulfate ABC transporter permease subunit CysW [Kurthia sibirica]GEK32745.1 sulfate ABC transporter permease subunit CysW [Kurthia sibirica]